MLENGVRPEVAQRGDKLVEKHRLHGDTSDMGAQGFAFHREKGFWREFGGFANYLNLEYYPGPLEGDDQVLAPLSQFLKESWGCAPWWNEWRTFFIRSPTKVSAASAGRNTQRGPGIGRFR